MARISIATDFTRTPGARFKSHGPYSGQEFREQFLEPLFRSGADTAIISIDLDGVSGYATSFLEEAFGGLARIFGRDTVKARVEFFSEDDPTLLTEIASYIDAVGSK